jgi:hypothetical protein
MGSKRFSISAGEAREVGILTAKIAGGGLLAVAGLYLSKLDFGPWDALATPLAIGLGDLARRLLTDTRPPEQPPYPPPFFPLPPFPTQSIPTQANSQ